MRGLAGRQQGGEVGEAGSADLQGENKAARHTESVVDMKSA